MGDLLCLVVASLPLTCCMERDRHQQIERCQCRRQVRAGCDLATEEWPDVLDSTELELVDGIAGHADEVGQDEGTVKVNRFPAGAILAWWRGRCRGIHGSRAAAASYGGNGQQGLSAGTTQRFSVIWRLPRVADRTVGRKDEVEEARDRTCCVGGEGHSDDSGRRRGAATTQADCASSAKTVPDWVQRTKKRPRPLVGHGRTSCPAC